MGVLEKVVAARGRKGWSEPLSWAYDDFRLPFLSSSPMSGDRETIENDFLGYVRGAYKSNGVIFACVAARQGVFSQARFKWRNFVNGEPGTPYGNQQLRLLEKPWVTGTTGELLSLAEVDVSLAGNFWATTADNNGKVGAAATGPGRRVVRMRPDWVTQVIGSHSGDPYDLDAQVIGILYHPNRMSGVFPSGAVDDRATLLLPSEVCHYSPHPDPEARFRGMSWLTPVIREIQADKAATQHKLKFFEQGAPQPIDAKLLTPTGWTTMGAISVGDRVIGSDGKPHDVVAVYPQGVRDIYRVHFSSGATVECTEDHLWTVASAYDRKLGTTRTMTLAQIVAGGVLYKSGPAKWSVPLVSPVEFDDPGPLPLDPYLIGTLIGDGSYRSNATGRGGVTLAAHIDDADEQQRLITPLLPEGVRVSRRDRGGWAEFYFALADRSSRSNALTNAIRELGMWDQLGHEKKVPDLYMRGSISQRVALLQGLIDTDGSVSKGQPNTVRFDSTSEVLARQVADLAASLGAVTSVRHARAARGGRRAQWRVTVTRLPEWITPCRLARKARSYRPTLRGGAYRYIQRVEFVGRKPAQCIGVDSSDHLYVTNDFVLTHNTPSMVFKFDRDTTPEAFKRFKDRFNSEHQGSWNAYKALFLSGGADVEVVGADLKQLDFAVTQGKGETRIAIAARVPAVILGISEGLAGSALNSGNYGQAKRNWSEGALQDLWSKAAASFENLVTAPADNAELYCDTRHIPFLREDAKDIADIQRTQAIALRNATDAGWDPDAAVRWLTTNDLTQLMGQHSGLFSVQLQPPGSDLSVPVTDLQKAAELLAAGWKAIGPAVPLKELPA